MQQRRRYGATIEASAPTCTHAAPCAAALRWSCTFDVESQNRGVVDPASAQESYLAKTSCNPRRLWRLAKSTLRGVLTVVGVRMTTILAIEVVTCAAPVLILSLHSVTTGLIVAKRCSDGRPLSGREQQRLQQQLREMLNYDRRQLNVLTEVVALLLHCMGIPDQVKPRRCDTWFSSRWFDPGWFDCMAMLGAMTYSAELYTWVSLAPAQVVGHSSGVNRVWGGGPSGPPQAPPEAGPPQAPIFWRFLLKIEIFLIKFSSKSSSLRAL